MGLSPQAGVPDIRGFSLIEIVIVIGVVGILMSLGWALMSNMAYATGQQGGANLRMVWLAQKRAMVDSMRNPAAAPDPNTYTLNSLLTSAEATSFSSADFNARYGTFTVTVIPPTSSLDGSRRDVTKTSPTTGDGIYDVGRER